MTTAHNNVESGEDATSCYCPFTQKFEFPLFSALVHNNGLLLVTFYRVSSRSNDISNQ